MGRSRSLFSHSSGRLESRDARVRARRCVLPSGEHHDFEGVHRQLQTARSRKRTTLPRTLGRRHPLSSSTAAPALVAANERGRLAHNRGPGRPRHATTLIVKGNPRQLMATALRPAYALYLRAVFGRVGVRWSVNGEELRIDPGVRRYVPHQNEPALFRYLQSAMQPGETVLDIGAFLGTYAIMAARWTGPLGRVLAFEPS